MGMTMVRCDDCGECFYAHTRGVATAMWREHFIEHHAYSDTDPEHQNDDTPTHLHASGGNARTVSP